MSFPTHIVAVGGIVEDGEGHVLMVKLRDRGWEFPGGQVENGEPLVAALRREVLEESGIAAEARHLVGVYSNTSSYKWRDGVTDVPSKVMFDFVCVATGGALAVSDETTESRWVPRDRALEMMTAPAIRTRFERYLNYDGRITVMSYVTRPTFAVHSDQQMPT
jgi:8-oxo-dGTP pyrophosphatase MutT (NUDIX family)